MRNIVIILHMPTNPTKVVFTDCLGNSKNTWYSTASKAGKNMKEVKIKVWDVNSKGKKFTRTFYVRVHKPRSIC